MSTTLPLSMQLLYPACLSPCLKVQRQANSSPSMKLQRQAKPSARQAPFSGASAVQSADLGLSLSFSFSHLNYLRHSICFLFLFRNYLPVINFCYRESFPTRKEHINDKILQVAGNYSGEFRDVSE